MKTSLLQSIPFAPLSKTLDFSAVPSFNIKNLYCVINQTASTIIYAVGTAGKGYTTNAANFVTLVFDTTAMNAGDQLQFIYEDTTIGSSSDSAATTDTGTFSIVAFIKRGLQNWTTFLARIGQLAAANSMSVTLSNENVQDLSIVGQAAQTAIINNILTTVAGIPSLDVTGYRSFCIQLVSTGTGGTFIFEGSNDPVNNFQPITVFNQVNANGGASNSAINASLSTIGYVGSTTFRYIRLRIVTTITGGSLQAFTRLSQVPFVANYPNVTQTNPANFNITAQPGNTPNTTPWLITPVANAAQGFATFLKLISAATTNATSVKASAGVIGSISIFNASASNRFLKFYNKASAPVVGTDIPVLVIGISAGNAVNFPVAAMGMRFSTGIALATTTGIADADTTAVALNDLAISINYL